MTDLTLHWYVVSHFADNNFFPSQTGFQFKNEEAVKLQGPPKYDKIQFSPYCYDATWTLAYALNETLQGEASCMKTFSPLSL